MAERSGRVEITADIDNQLQAALSGISSSVRGVLEVTNALSRNTSNSANAAKQLTSALHGVNSSSTLYTRAVHSLIRNQAVLAHHFRNSAKAAEELSAMQKNNTKMTDQEKASIDRLVSSLRAQEAARKGVMQFAYQADLRRQSDALNQMANRYSMAGNRMSMALTLPIVGFMRTAFSSFKAVEAETVRTEKLINDSFKSMEQVANEINLGLIDAKIVKDGLAYQKVINGITYEYQTLEGALNELEKGLDKISLKYGVSRELVQGLTGDFAELGIESIPALVGLTEMTAAVEKLGNVDISQSQEFIKSIFQTVLRLKRQTGTLERTADGAIDYANSIKEVRQQVALFNLLENKTQLSLKSTADAFPEVTAAATSFGLSMSEAMALVVPMVSAGFQVGASANSVKVSLQRVVDLTKENSTMIDTLRQTQAGFNFEAGVSVKNIQQLSDAYGELKKGDLGEQGALEFFSKLFGVRQGPRMEVAIANLNQFQEDINRGLNAIAGGPNMRTVEGDIVNRLEEAVQRYSKLQGLGQNFTNMSVKNFADLGEVVRLSQSQNEQISKAFGQARSEVAAYISEEAKKGNDLLAKVSTESGRAILVAAVGNEEAARKFEQEVEMQLATTQNRFAQARETFKSIGRQIVPVLAQILEAFLPILMKLNDFFDKMPSWSKALLGISLIILAAIGPVMKLMGSITQLRSSLLSLRASGGVFGKMKSQTKEIGVEFLTADSAALKFKNRLTEIGGKFFLKGTAKEIRNLEKLMTLEAMGENIGRSGRRRVKRLEDRLGISKRSVDMSGLSESTVQDIARRSDVDLGMLGYRKPSFGDNPATAMIYEKAGETLGYAFLGVLRQNGFDPTTVKAAVKASTAKAVPVTVQRRGRKPDDDDPGTGGGTGGGGPRRPSTGPTGTGGSGAAATVPVDVDIAGVGLTPAIKKNAMDLTHVIEKGTKDVLKTMAKSLNIAKINGKTISAVGVKELRQALINYMKGVKDGITFKPADAQKIKSAAITTAGANAPPIPSPAKKVLALGIGKLETAKAKLASAAAGTVGSMPIVMGAVDVVKETSDEGTKKVQKSHAKKTKKAVKKQSEDTVKAIEQQSASVKLVKSPGDEIPSIAPTARKYSSTVQQMLMNAQLAVAKPVDEVIEALNLVKKTGTGSSKTFIFTKQKFFELANLLGIQLPPVFNQMGELLNEKGEALGVTKERIQELITALTKTRIAPEEFGPQLAGKTVLDFETELNRALSSGSKKRFNFSTITGKVKKAFSSAFSTTTGDIFSDITRKMPSKAGRGKVDYTSITFKDLEKVSGLREAKGGTSRKLKAEIGKANQDLIGTLAKLKVGVDKEAPVTIQQFREYVKLTRRVVDALIAQTVPGRAQKAVVRRELTFGPRYEQMLKSPKALDLMSESEYAEFNKKRMAGIDAARTRSEQLKEKIDLGPSRAVSKLTDEQKADIKAREAMSQVGNRNQNIPRLLDPETKKVLFDIDERIKRYIKNRTDELIKSFGSLDAVPKGALRSATEAARTKVAKELNESKRRQVADITKANEGLQNKLLDTGLTDTARKEINDQIKKNDQLVVAIEKAFKSQMDKLKKMTIDTAPKPAGGGAGKTSLSMGTSMLDPFGGLGGPKAMGPRAPQIGPSLAFVDKGGVPAGVSSVYEEIRQALNIPTKIMDQVIADLKVKHNKITQIGTMSKTEVNASLTQLIEVLRTNMTGVDMTVDNVKDAIVAQRNRIYGLTSKVATKTASSKTEQDALVAQTMESIVKSKKATNEYLTFTDRPLRKLAEALNKISEGKFKIDTKAKMDVRKQQITDALKKLGVTVEEAVTKSVVKPVTETVETVKSTGAVLALGMGKLETARAKLAAAAAGTVGSIPIVMGPVSPVMPAVTPVSTPAATSPSAPGRVRRGLGSLGGFIGTASRGVVGVGMGVGRRASGMVSGALRTGGNLAGSAVSMAGYQFGTGGMIAAQGIQSLITGLMRVPKVGGPVLIMITAIIGLFVILKRTTEAWSKYSNGAVEKFKAAFDKLKEIVGSLLAPFADFFASFLGGSKEGDKSMEDLGNTIGNIADKVLEFMPKLQEFVNEYVIPVIRVILSGFKLLVESVWPLIKAVVDFVKIIVKLFTGDFKGAWESTKDMLGNLKDAIEKIFLGLLVILAPVVKAIVTLFFALVTAILNLIEQIPIFFVNSLRWMAKTNAQIVFSIAQVFVGFVDVVLTIFAGLISGIIRFVQIIANVFAFAFGAIAKGFINLVDMILEGIGTVVERIGSAFGFIPFIGEKVKNASAGLSNSLGGAMDSWRERAERAQDSVMGAIDSSADSAVNFVNKIMDAGNAMGRWVQDLQNKYFGVIDSIADAANSAIGSLSNISATGRDAINRLIDDAVSRNMIRDGIGEAVQKGLEDGFQGFDDPTVPDAAGKAIGDAVKESLKSAASSFYDAVLGNLANAIQKSAEDIGEILNQQKEDALKAYDDQIEGINALAEAEERLTATEEYESNRRKRIRERDLQRNNYEKNRALAIYEGRVDDARNLDLEELKNAEDFAKEISDMDRDRQKKLQSENRQDAISIIKNNKENAAKLFEEAIKEFEQYVEEVTKNGTISEEQLSEQFEKIAEKANLTSGSINDTFKDSFSKLPALIQTGLDPTTSESGFFSTEIGKLVDIAKTKFGITVGVGTQDANSILGLTGILLSSQSQGIPAAISAAFADGGVIQSTYGTGLDNLSQYIAEKNNPANTNSLAAIFKKAIADANAAMEQEFLKGQRGIGSAFDKIISQLNDSVKNLAIAEGIKKGMEEAAKAAGEGAQQVVDAAAGAGSVDKKVDKIWARSIAGGRWIDVTYPAKFNEYKTMPGVIFHYGGSKPPAFFKGGAIPYGEGGPTIGPVHQGIPAILHGGEYVVRNSAVKKYGSGMMQQINQGTFKPKEYFLGGIVDKAKGFAKGMGREAKAAFYDPLIRLQEATFNPLMKLFRVPGSKNLKVATPSQAAYSAFETSLALFGGPAIGKAASKIAKVGSKVIKSLTKKIKKIKPAIKAINIPKIIPGINRPKTPIVPKVDKPVSNSLVPVNQFKNFVEDSITRENRLTMLGRGVDLDRIIESGVIDSTLDTASGYIGNAKMLQEIGQIAEGYESYNRVRTAMQLPTGPLRGNINYGIARRYDDFMTANSYTRFRINIGEMGQFLGSKAGADKYHFESQMDKLLGQVWVDLRPSKSMTFTLGDSWNMYSRSAYAPEPGYNYISDSIPAPRIPFNIDDIPLTNVYGKEMMPAHGDYTEIQFPRIPFNRDHIQSVTILRDSLDSIYRGPGVYGWGAEREMFVGPQEALVMQRELAKKVKKLGIPVKTGTMGGFDKNMVSKPVYDMKALSDLTDKEFETMLRRILNKKRIADIREQRRYMGVERFASFFNGGKIPGFGSQVVPANLHGGEYIIRKSSVEKYGLDMLNQMNKGIYMPKKPAINVPISSHAKIATPTSGSGAMTSESTHNYNIYVDNFIGETEWFNSMMREYNMKVVPANQKQAGLESRIIKTYNGINRGM